MEIKDNYRSLKGFRFVFECCCSWNNFGIRGGRKQPKKAETDRDNYNPNNLNQFVCGEFRIQNVIYFWSLVLNGLELLV